MKRKIHQKCGIIKSLPEEHYCGEPVIGMSTGGVLVCEEHARMLVGRNIKVTQLDAGKRRNNRLRAFAESGLIDWLYVTGG